MCLFLINLFIYEKIFSINIVLLGATFNYLTYLVNGSMIRIILLVNFIIGF